MNKILSRALFCLVLMILGTAENAKSANLSVNPSITVQGIWDSNIFNASYQNEQSDFIFRATPSLTFGVSAWDTTMRIGFSGELDQYNRFKELNSFSATKVFDLGVEKPFQITPRLQVRPMAKFVSTRDAVRRNQIEQVSGSGEIPTTESVVTSRTAVRDYMGGLQISYALTPSLDAGIGGAYMDRRYPENPPGLFDSKTLSGNGSLSYRFTPRFTSGFFAEASKTTYVEKPESQVITVALTSAYEISEVFKGDVKAGASRLEEATTFGIPEERLWVPTGVVGITYHRKDFSTRLESSYGISGGGSYGTATKRGTVLFSMADRFGENWNGNGSLSYQTNRSTTDPVLEDIETWSGMVGIQYTFKPWMSFGVSGTRQYQGSKGSVGDNLRKNMIYIGVTISKTYPLI